MAIFIVALISPDEEIKSKIQQSFPAASHLKLTDTLFMVKPQVSSVHAVCEQLGISAGEDSSSGLVVEISDKNATGVLPSAFVDWYREARRVDRS